MTRELKAVLFVFIFAAAPALSYLSMARAQDLEDSLEAELGNDQPTPVSETVTEVDSEAPSQAPSESIAEPSPANPSESILPPTAEPTRGAESEEPNLQFEKRVFRIFAKSRPVSSEKWTEMIGSRKEDVYVVQSGDTLWDISKTLFGDGFFWSKLWAENRAVENPHVISRGKGIRFVAGNEDSGPLVDVVSEKVVEMISVNGLRDQKAIAPIYREQALKELTPEELMSQNVIEVDELVPRPEIPLSSRLTKRMMPTELPPSFVGRKPVQPTKYDITGLDPGQNRSMTSTATITPNFYITDVNPDAVGKIEEIEVGDQVASLGENVFVRIDRPVQNGDRFTVIFPRGKLKDKVRGSVGPVVEVGGVVQIVELVDEKKSVYRAFVTKSVNPIRKGSLLVAEPLPQASFARRGTRLNLEMRIIGGEYDENRRVIGEGGMVYLDGGTREGLSVGDILPIQSRRASRKPSSKYPELRRTIGLLKIVRVDATVATALVLEAQEEIAPGDRTGGGLPELARPIRDDQEAKSEQ